MRGRDEIGMGVGEVESRAQVRCHGIIMLVCVIASLMPWSPANAKACYALVQLKWPICDLQQ